MRFATLSAVALAGVVAAAPYHLFGKREWEALKSDVADIGDDILVVRDALTNFTASDGYFAALNIDSQAQTLLQALQTATTEAQNTPPLSANQSSFGVEFLTDLLPFINQTLNQFILKEPDFKSLLVAGIAKADNAALANASDAFADALLAIADPSVHDEGVALKQSLDDAFALSTAAYAND